MSTIATSEAAASPSYMVQRSTWHSPVPYLFGGLAAMLGLIAFALLILACSYWKLSGQINDAERDVEAGEGYDGEKVVPPVLEEKFLVIMAGQVNPTFLATPMSSRASSFGSTKSSSCNCSSTSGSEGSTLAAPEEKKENDNGQVEMGNLEAQQDLESQVH